MERPLLDAQGLAKRFGGVAALVDGSLTIAHGERHAIVGENGAGKSTLIKVLSGNLAPDAGSMLLDGAPYRPASPAAARRHGITVIHQELSIIPDLTVAENIFLGALPVGRLGQVDRGRLDRDARAVLARLGLDMAPSTVARRLSIAQQQMVEIAKGVASGARLIIMDEPTSSLGPREADRLWAVVSDLIAAGTTIAFVSHKLDEVLAHAGRVTVLRDGATVARAATPELDTDRLVALMVGRNLGKPERAKTAAAGDVVLEVEGVSRGTRVREARFCVQAGEIVGFAGLVGAGRTELMRCVFGVDRPEQGVVKIAGATLPPGDPIAAIRAGLALVPEDRKGQGLFASMSILENMAMPAFPAGPLGLLRRGRDRRAAEDGIARLGIAAHSVDQGAATLSGGNQQKMMLARWLALAPKVLIVDEPTRGIDVGAKREIYDLLRGLAASGPGIVVVSSEIPELIELAGRVLVMREGRIVGELRGGDINEDAIGRLQVGL